MALDKYGIAKRIAQELKYGMYVNLGIGIPTLVANYIPKNIEVFFSDKQNNEKEFDSVVTIMEETTKKMFDKAFEYFSIKSMK